MKTTRPALSLGAILYLERCGGERVRVGGGQSCTSCAEEGWCL